MRVYITGITGTLGTAIAELHKGRSDLVQGCSRNEERVKRWQRKHCNCECFACDAGSFEMLSHMRDADRIYHCAAMKHVDIAEQIPLEAWRQNVELTARVVADGNGPKTVFISSDKAANARNVYGASKLTGERIALNAGAAVVRFGNLIGSSGSVLQLWDKADTITLTDPDMSRYFIPVKEAAIFAANSSLFGQLTVSTTMRAARMGDLAEVFGKPVKIIGPRPGETTHQWLIAPGETANGTILPYGLFSREAPRWDAEKLLEVYRNA